MILSAGSGRQSLSSHPLLFSSRFLTSPPLLFSPSLLLTATRNNIVESTPRRLPPPSIIPSLLVSFNQANLLSMSSLS